MPVRPVRSRRLTVAVSQPDRAGLVAVPVAVVGFDRLGSTVSLHPDLALDTMRFSSFLANPPVAAVDGS